MHNSVPVGSSPKPVHTSSPLHWGADLSGDLREAINDKQCRVCALGGLFTANVLRNDQFPADNAFIDGYDDTLKVESFDMRGNLERIFSQTQLELIEAVFETEFVTDNFHSEAQIERLEPLLLYYRDKYPNDSDRMRAIMLNIIRNKGKFVPPKRFTKK